MANPQKKKNNQQAAAPTALKTPMKKLRAERNRLRAELATIDGTVYARCRAYMARFGTKLTKSAFRNYVKTYRAMEGCAKATQREVAINYRLIG